MVNDDFQTFFKMPVIRQTVIRHQFDPHLVFKTYLSTSRDHSSSNTIELLVSCIGFGFIEYLNLQGVGTKTREDRDGTGTKPSLWSTCLNETQVASTKVFALSNVRDMAARTVKVFPRPISSAIKPPVSIGMLELLLPLILFLNLGKSVCHTHAM